LECIYDDLSAIPRPTASCPQINIVLDISRVSSPPSSVQLRTLGYKIGYLSCRYQFRYCAMVADSDLMYGISRMLQAYTEDCFEAVRVFRSRGDAIVWLQSKLTPVL
jgi:hypothetical protein